MKILHVSSWFQPQLGYSEYHLPLAQQNQGHTVAVLTSDRYFPFPEYDTTVKPLLGKRIVGSGQREERGLNVYRLPVAFEYRHHLWLRGFERALDQFAPDVVHTHEFFTPVALQSALAKQRAPYTLVMTSSMEKEVFFPQSLPRRLYYQFHRRSFSKLLRERVDAFTAVGTGAREIVSYVVGIPADQIEVIPLGADSTRFRFDAAARKEIRNQLGVTDETMVIVYAGKLIAEKDIHVLVEAFARLPTQLPATLILLGNGSGSYVEQLRFLAQGALDKIFFLPAVPNENLPPFFCAADVGVWPNQSSNAAIEASLVGLPLIVCDDESARHYVEAENGLRFPRGDVSALSECLRRLVASPALRHQMAERGRAYMQSHRSWQTIAQRYLTLYLELPKEKTNRTI
jgi:glycosyltransferase involved in cell wall biosynthesis